jgi:hypothetical protein
MNTKTNPILQTVEDALTAGVMDNNLILVTPVALARIRRMDTRMMQLSETVRVETTVSENAMLAVNEMDRSHLMITKCKDSIPSIFQHTPMVPRMYHTTVLPLILLQLTTFLPLQQPICNGQKVDNPIKIWAANGGILDLVHVGEISLPQLPPQAHHVHVIPGLASMSVLAMGPLCDVRCMIEFNATTIHV